MILAASIMRISGGPHNSGMQAPTTTINSALPPFASLASEPTAVTTSPVSDASALRLPASGVARLQHLGVIEVSGEDAIGFLNGQLSNDLNQLAPSQARLAAEQAWLASGLPVQIFRLPAIYGPGRSPFASLRAGQSRLIHKPLMPGLSK